MAISPDGSAVYVATAASNALVVLARNPSTGALAQATDGSGCIVEAALTGCATGSQLAGANAVATSGNTAFVTSLLSNSVTSFNRSSSGAVTETVRPPTPVVTGAVAGSRVRFSWTVPGGSRSGDTFLWLESETGRQDRTSKTSLKLPYRGKRCLQVTLLRGSGGTATQSAPSAPVCAG